MDRYFLEERVGKFHARFLLNSGSFLAHLIQCAYPHLAKSMDSMNGYTPLSWHLEVLSFRFCDKQRVCLHVSGMGGSQPSAGPILDLMLNLSKDQVRGGGGREQFLVKGVWGSRKDEGKDDGGVQG